MIGIVDETKMYRCDTPILFKVTNYNWPVELRVSDSVIRVDQIESFEHLYGAAFPAQLMDWQKRRKIRRFILPVPNVDYTQYALQQGQPCTCDKHKEQ